MKDMTELKESYAKLIDVVAGRDINDVINEFRDFFTLAETRGDKKILEKIELTKKYDLYRVIAANDTPYSVIVEKEQHFDIYDTPTSGECNEAGMLITLIRNHLIDA